MVASCTRTITAYSSILSQGEDELPKQTHRIAKNTRPPSTQLFETMYIPKTTMKTNTFR